MKIFLKVVFLNSLLAQGAAELLTGHAVFYPGSAPWPLLAREARGTGAFGLIQPGHPFVQTILSPECSDQLFKFPQMLAANLQPLTHFRHYLYWANLTPSPPL